MFIFSSLTWPGLAGPFPGTLTTTALYRRSFRWFGIPACTANPEGHTSITGTARLVLAIFYIVITFLSGHTTSGSSASDQHVFGRQPLHNCTVSVSRRVALRDVLR
ncbi:MAG: hypothetical protein M3066_07280 [Actinomycetota bacterium]|nr:hypothetical protein [Actinomycetota bacterium]